MQSIIASEETIVISSESGMVMVTLVAHRKAQGFTQRDVAVAMGCTQSKVAKLEARNVKDVNLYDLRQYVKAIGMEMNISIV